MITDEMLRKAAEESCLAYTDSIIAALKDCEEHVFSKKFERKIERIKKNIGRPKWIRPMQRVASVFLAVIVGASVWLGVDAEARTKAFAWIKEIRGDHFIFHFEGKSDNTGAKKNYRPAWIPEGYNEYKVREAANTVVVIYENEKNEFLKFGYSYSPDDTYWFLDIEGKEKTAAEVNGCPAELYISNTSESASGIIWISTDGTAFFVSAFLEKEDLIEFSENIRETEEK